MKKHKASIFFKYPSLSSLRKIKPELRVDFIDKKFQNYLIKIRSILSNQDFAVMGRDERPRGIEVEMSTQSFKSILKLPFIDSTLSTIKDSKKVLVNRDESYFCFKVIFKAQIESQLKGFQTIEDRFILVRADNYAKAEAKIKKESKQYEEPYLNSDGYFVRWKFDSIEDSFQTFISSKKDFDGPMGIEVFSKYGKRKLRKADIWNGN